MEPEPLRFRLIFRRISLFVENRLSSEFLTYRMEPEPLRFRLIFRRVSPFVQNRLSSE